MNTQLKSVWAGIEEIVGAGHLWPAGAEDAVDDVRPQIVVEPGSSAEVAGVLQRLRNLGLRVVTRGGGTKLDWGNPPGGIDLLLSTRRLNRIIEHVAGDMTATVEAGCRVRDFQDELGKYNQRLALDPLWPARATIGGVLATNDSGALRARFGSLRDLLIGVTIALADGTVAKSGGRVVKNVAGYDLPKLLIGSMGTLGVVTEATFRLYPLPPETRTLSFALPTFAAMNLFVLTIQDSLTVPTGLQFRAAGEEIEADVRYEGVGPAIESQFRRLAEICLAAGAKELPSTSGDVWNEREKLFEGAGESALVCKVCVLPTQLAHLCELVKTIGATSRAAWRLTGQGIGICLLRLESCDDENLTGFARTLREELTKLGGSLAVLRCPRAMKNQLDVWGDAGTALPLMRRVKEQFDPTGLLSPGRFIGGI